MHPFNSEPHDNSNSLMYSRNPTVGSFKGQGQISSSFKQIAAATKRPCQSPTRRIPSKRPLFRTIAPKPNINHLAANYPVPNTYVQSQSIAIPQQTSSQPNANASVTPDSLVFFGDLDSSLKDLDPELRQSQCSYVDAIVPRNRLRVVHRFALRPLHTIPRTPNGVFEPFSKHPSKTKTEPKIPQPIGTVGLRPIAHFLTRIGMELVRSQYEPIIGQESHVRSTRCHLNSPRKRKKTDKSFVQIDMQSFKSDLSVIDVRHLQWQRKQLPESVQYLEQACRDRKCPYLATSTMHLLHHLEQGHQVLTFSKPFKRRSRRRLESPDLDSFYLNVNEQEGDDLVRNFFIPLVLHPEITSLRSCPLCPLENTALTFLKGHLSRCHPMISLKPLKRSKFPSCSVCGLQVAIAPDPGCTSGIVLHPQCASNLHVYDNSPWSGSDAHALACFMLYPTYFARIILPFRTASFIHRLINHMISARIRQFGEWTIQSYTLRCCSAISVIFGELVDPVMIRPLPSLPSLQVELDTAQLAKSNPTSSVANRESVVSAAASIQNPNPSPPQSRPSAGMDCSISQASSLVVKTPAISVCNSAQVVPPVCVVPLPTVMNKSPGNQPVILPSQTSPTFFPTLMLNPSSNTQTSLNTQTRLNITLPSNVSVRSLGGISTGSSLPTKNPDIIFRTPVVNTPISLSNNIRPDPSRLIPTCSPNPVLVHWGSRQTLINVDTRPPTTILPKPSSLNFAFDLTTPTQSTVPTTSATNSGKRIVAINSAEGLDRVPALTSISCEVCGGSISTDIQKQYTHFSDHHGYTRSRCPSKRCPHCGQMFWTTEGCLVHQQVKCGFCGSPTLCRSTYYTHMILRHKEHLANLLKSPLNHCFICPVNFDNRNGLIDHLKAVHSFMIPTDLDAPKTDNSHLGRLEVLYSSLPSTAKTVQPLVYPLPRPMLFDNPANSKHPYHICSVCNCLFESTAHLDLHMCQSGHQYWCPSCPFACKRAIIMWKHFTLHRNSTEIQAHTLSSNLASFKVIKTSTSDKPSQDPGFLKTAPEPSLPSVSVSSPATFIGNVAQFHRCDLCPVFCMTLDDLNLHKRTAHFGAIPAVIAQVPTPTPILASILPPANVVTAISLQSTRGLPMNAPTTIIASAALVPNTVTVSVTNSVPSLNIRPVSCHANSSELTHSFVASGPEKSASQTGPGNQINTTTTTTTNNNNNNNGNGEEYDDDEDAELICPMCEYHSVDRADVMQHIVDKH